MFDFVTFDADLGLYILRLGVGAVFLYHGWGKLVNPGKAAKMLKWSPVSVMILSLFEIFGALMLIIGFTVQFGAAILATVAIGAVYVKVMKMGATFSDPKKGGYEFEMLLLAGSLAILLTGGGALGFVQHLQFLVGA